MWTVPVDVTGLDSSIDMISRIKAEISLLSGTPSASPEIRNIDQEAIKDIIERSGSGRLRPDDMVKVILTGRLDVLAEKNLQFIKSELSSLFYYVKVADETQRYVDYQSFVHDKSLKGEFIRSVRDDVQLRDDIKPEVIETGIRLLMGERV